MSGRDDVINEKQRSESERFTDEYNVHFVTEMCRTACRQCFLGHIVVT